jgi:hypothetical protein
MKCPYCRNRGYNDEMLHEDKSAIRYPVAGLDEKATSHPLAEYTCVICEREYTWTPWDGLVEKVV